MRIEERGFAKLRTETIVCDFVRKTSAESTIVWLHWPDFVRKTSAESTKNRNDCL